MQHMPARSSKKAVSRLDKITKATFVSHMTLADSCNSKAQTFCQDGLDSGSFKQTFSLKRHESAILRFETGEFHMDRADTTFGSLKVSMVLLFGLLLAPSWWEHQSSTSTF